METTTPGLAQDAPVQPQIVAQHRGFHDVYDEGLARTGMVETAWRRPRFFHMTQMLGLTAGLPGETCECGVYRGLASFLICSARRREDRSFDGSGHTAIDSFEGLPEPDAVDGAQARAGVFGDTSVERVRRTLGGFPGVRLVRGWIPGALAELNPRAAYRFVHVDLDLHAPTRACLEHFYPRLVPGGILVVDDFGPWPTGEWPGCRAAVEGFAWDAGVPFAALDTGNAVFVKRG